MITAKLVRARLSRESGAGHFPGVSSTPRVRYARYQGSEKKCERALGQLRLRMEFRPEPGSSGQK